MRLPSRPEGDYSGIIRGLKWSVAAAATAIALSMSDAGADDTPATIAGCDEDVPDTSKFKNDGRLIRLDENGRLMIHTDLSVLPLDARLDQAARVSEDVRKLLASCKGDKKTSTASEFRSDGMKAITSIECEDKVAKECHVGFKTEQGEVSFETTLIVTCGEVQGRPSFQFLASSINTLCVEEAAPATFAFPCLYEVVTLHTPDEQRIAITTHDAPYLGRLTPLNIEDARVSAFSSMGPQSRSGLSSLLDIAGIEVPKGTFQENTNLFEAMKANEEIKP